MGRGKRVSLAQPMPTEFERILLGSFESKSKPGTFYEVRLGHDNVLYCTCKAWRFLKNGAVARTCPHTRNVQAALNRLQPGAAAATAAAERQKKGTEAAALDTDVKVRAFLPFDEGDNDE